MASNKNREIVAAIGVQIIGHSKDPWLLQLHAGFFGQFTDGALFRCFAFFQVTTGKGPAAIAQTAPALS